MKYFFYFSILLFVFFCIYVAIVNRDSKQMTLRQKILKAVYPVVIWYSKKAGTVKMVLSKNDELPPVSIYSLNDILTNGELFNFNRLKNKKILLVNTASDCGYTGQYEDLEKLSRQYHDKLAVIGFPSNDFSEQEKEDDNAIAKFCKINYGVSFMLMKKTTVKRSADQNKIYQWLTDQRQNGWNTKAPSWNFCKYLVDENGRLKGFFGPAIEPLGKELSEAINN